MNLDDFKQVVVTSIADQNLSNVAIPEGWIDKVYNCYNDLIQIDSNINISHILQKNGRIDFVAYEPYQEVIDRIAILEQDLLTVCEVCGGEGSMKRFSEDKDDPSQDHVFCEECIKPEDPYA